MREESRREGGVRTFCAVTVLVVLIWLAERLGASETASLSSPSKRKGAFVRPSFRQRCFQNSESWTLYMLYCRDIPADAHPTQAGKVAAASEQPAAGKRRRRI